MNNMGANLLEGSVTSLGPHVRPLRWLVGWVCTFGLYVVSFLKGEFTFFFYFATGYWRNLSFMHLMRHYKR